MVFYAAKHNGKIYKFDSWNSCSSFVKGKSNVRYKKFDSEDDMNRYFQNENPSSDEVFTIDYFVYTDGACSNNGNRKVSKAGYGIYFGENDSRNVSKRLYGHQTNNTAELRAIIHAFDLIEKDAKAGKILS